MTRLVARAGARSVLQAWLDAHGTLLEAAAARPGAFTLRGRGTVWVVPAPERGSGERWVVRHYHRGGAVARLLGDRYLAVGVPRPIRELRVALEADARGVPTPPPVGAAVYGAPILYRGDLVTEYVPGSMDLAAVLFPDAAGAKPDPLTTDPPDPFTAMTAAGRLVRRIHEAGLLHPDLNLKNILLAGDGPSPAQVIDLDRARFRDAPLGEPARRRMLDRFWRSAGKWQRLIRADEPLDPGLRAAFEDGYAAGD